MITVKRDYRPRGFIDALIRIGGGGLTASPLPHYRTYWSRIRRLVKEEGDILLFPAIPKTVKALPPEDNLGDLFHGDG